MIQNWLWLIPALPLVGFFINGLFGKRIPKPMVAAIACLLPLLSFGISVACLRRVHEGTVLKDLVYNWIQAPGFSVDLTLRVDVLSVVMLLIVTGVGFLIHVYSYGYMRHDPGLARYFAYLNLFMAAMLILVLADSLPVMFVGWEGVGLCSYLLIGFWFKDGARADAGKKAFIVNRIGDLGFLIGMFMLFQTFGALDFDSLSSPIGELALTLPCLLLFLGATGKSAQIPLYVWLPDAMAGPTPVSALIHAATMVTAGVYMIARLHVIFSLAPAALEIIGLIGAATAFMAGVMAITEFNIKKVLAYSTISQLAYMFCGVASEGYSAGIFHLVTHAFFKAMLFLGAGVIIHHLSNEEDMRRMGGLRKKMPLTFLCFIIGSLAISGIPPFSGFFSKEAILSSIYPLAEQSLSWSIVFGLLIAASFVTAFYMFRLIILTFFGEGHAHEGHDHDVTMSFALIALLILSAAGGFFPIEHLLAPMYGSHAAHSDKIVPILALSAAVLGIGTAIFLYGRGKIWLAKFVQSTLGKPLHALVDHKFYIDELYEFAFVLPMNMTAFVLWLVVDRLIIDTILVNGSAAVLYRISAKSKALQPGALNASLATMALGALAVLGYLAYILVYKGI